MLAADQGTLAAITIALVGLVGTLIANVVGFIKIRSDAATETKKLTQEHQKSNVEIAQSVMAQTVETLNNRLKGEAENHEKKIKELREEHALEIQKLRNQHAEDMRRLEQRVNELSDSYNRCRISNQQLSRQLRAYERERKNRG